MEAGGLELGISVPTQKAVTICVPVTPVTKEAERRIAEACWPLA